MPVNVIIALQFYLIGGISLFMATYLYFKATAHLKDARGILEQSRQISSNAYQYMNQARRSNGDRITELLKWNVESENRRRKAEWELAERREEIDLLEEELANVKAALVQAQIDEQASVNVCVQLDKELQISQAPSNVVPSNVSDNR